MQSGKLAILDLSELQFVHKPVFEQDSQLYGHLIQYVPFNI